VEVLPADLISSALQPVTLNRAKLALTCHKAGRPDTAVRKNNRNLAIGTGYSMFCATMQTLRHIVFGLLLLIAVAHAAQSNRAFLAFQRSSVFRGLVNFFSPCGVAVPFVPLSISNSLQMS
jgi:hypothetical protein